MVRNNRENPTNMYFFSTWIGDQLQEILSSVLERYVRSVSFITTSLITTCGGCLLTSDQTRELEMCQCHRCVNFQLSVIHSLFRRAGFILQV